MIPSLKPIKGCCNCTYFSSTYLYCGNPSGHCHFHPQTIEKGCFEICSKFDLSTKKELYFGNDIWDIKRESDVIESLKSYWGVKE